MPGYAYQAGDHIGSYRVVDEVASGDTQQVYLVRDNKRDRELVLRLAVDNTTDPDDATVTDDARKARQLSHPNLVDVVDLGVHDGHRYVVSEAVDGTRLDRWLDGKQSWRDIVRAFEQIARGLASAHSEGLARQAFAPDQVVVVTNQKVRVVDLGLARTAPPIDARENQAAVSRAMFVALHGADPLSDSRIQPPPPPVDSEVPQPIHRAMVKSLARDPDHRFADMSALADELQRSRTDPPRGKGGKLAVAAVAILALAAVAYFAALGT